MAEPERPRPRPGWQPDGSLIVHSYAASSELTARARDAGFVLGWSYTVDARRTATQAGSMHGPVCWHEISEPLKLWLMLNYVPEENAT